MRVAANVYEIDPRRYRKDRFYTGFLIVFWIVWAPVTVGVTGYAGTGEGPQGFLLFWLCFGWLGVFLIPWVLLAGGRKQRLTSEAGRLVVSGSSLLGRSQEIRDLKALTLEHQDEESILTLNLLSRSRPWRVMLGSLVHPDDKEVLFGEISAFLHEQGFVFEARNERHAGGA